MKHRDPSRFPDGFYRSIARSYGVSLADEDDAVQEMKLAVWQGHNLRYRLIDFMRHNTLGSWQRARKQTTQTANPQPLTAETVLLREEPLADLVTLGMALKALPQRERGIFLLHEAGYRFWEIGRAYGLSEVRACHLYKHTTARLRSELSADRLGTPIV